MGGFLCYILTLLSSHSWHRSVSLNILLLTSSFSFSSSSFSSFFSSSSFLIFFYSSFFFLLYTCIYISLSIFVLNSIILLSSVPRVKLSGKNYAFFICPQSISKHLLGTYCVPNTVLGTMEGMSPVFIELRCQKMKTVLSLEK